MKRRVFIKRGALAGAVAAGLPFVQACKTSIRDKSSGIQQSEDFPLKELSILQLQQDLKSGRYTSEKLVELYLRRIRTLDTNGPALNSIIEINPDASELARQLDLERKSGKIKGPLHGIPVMIKDNIDTADKMHTSAGSLALADYSALRDAFVVKKLRQAGAILLGKTNLSEWANFRSTRSSSGWSGRGGQTRNPYITDRNPCGSSSGSAVAVSANLCAVAIGTETDGSIVCPSSSNGIVGLKPTLGLWSRTGIIPIAHSQDTAGPMTRSVYDAAVVLGLLAGIDPEDPATGESNGKTSEDYTVFLKEEGLQDARIGVARNFFGFNDQVDRLLEEAIQIMRKKGAHVVDPANIDTSREIENYEFNVLLYEFKADLNRYLSGTPSGNKYRSLKDLIVFNDLHHEEEMPWFGQEIFLLAEKKGPLTDQAYLDALKKLKSLAGPEGIDATLQKSKLDAIVAPTGGPAWATDWVNGDHFSGGSSSPAACAGYPAITVPAGFIHGLPVGITFMGPAWSEPVLLKLAYSYEQTTKHRKAPEFLPSLT